MNGDTMKVFSTAYSLNGYGRQKVFWPFLISLAGHLLLFGVVLYTPSSHGNFDGSFFPSVIDVQMVEMPSGAAAAAPVKTAAPEKAPVLVTQPPPAAETGSESTKEAEVSLAPKEPKVKTALKYKTIKTKDVLKSALERLEKKVESSPPKPLQDTLERLREQVAREGRPESSQSTAGEGAAQQGSEGGYAAGSRQEGELIDIYRTEVAYTINKNWAFSEQLAGGEKGLVASLVFKVMPDGRIEDIFFTDRSSNQYLNDSAYKAIVKSSPVKPLPDKLNRPYVEMGLRFTPKGIQ